MVRKRFWAVKTMFSLALFLMPVFGLGEGTMLVNEPGPLWGYFHPAWAPSAYSPVDGSDLAHFATDPSQRLESEFRAPHELRDRVLFWAAIYSRYSSQMRVLHDRRNPSLVYGYLDFSPLFRRHSFMGASILARRIESQVRYKLERSLLAIGGMGSSPLSDRHQELLRRYLTWHGINSKLTIEEAVVSMRSQTGQSDVFQSAIVRSREWLPKIEEVFASHGLPKGLARIPFVESSFNPKARSKIGAMGLWQFVPRTAKEMIHRSDRRKWKDPVEQTYGAARLLRRYRKALPDWASTVTSYNSGIGRVSRLLETHPSGIAAIRASDTRGELGFAGKSFFAEVLAANLVEAYQREIFEPVRTEVITEAQAPRPQSIPLAAPDIRG